MTPLEVNRIKRKLARRKASRIGAYSAFVQHARHRGHFVDLTASEWRDLTGRPCRYCGGVTARNAFGVGYVGIDRLDSSRGYTLDNVVPCCKLCNYGKSTLTPEAYLAHCLNVCVFNYAPEVLPCAS